MNRGTDYIMGLKNAYEKSGFLKEWRKFEASIVGANEEEIQKIITLFPDCPNSLLELLRYADGTYHRQYGKETVSFYFLGSDLCEYPYYLLSSEEICTNENIALRYYSDYIERKYDEVIMDEKITDNPKNLKWLHFSDCMNNGGTSQLFIDFSPSEKGVKGQIVRFLHDPDEFKVIANSFDEYLEKIMVNGYDFINEDSI